MKNVLFYLIIAIAVFGLIMNLDFFIMGFIRMIVSLIIFGLIIYLIYYFFFLTPDQRKYKIAMRKQKRRNR
ncbi:SA1362 family protein [Mammaliicoccus sciuri]|uniref:SA1362 family protein n=1 Tax=Mammaliicoccus sciuri TaxID=1296 RepID=UPI0027EB6E79|nr:SA1362 family protein [Mammaliicoccus sciuri]MDQ7129857.1 SA1362 family protein [Mammaliicoccus sciuri]